MTGDDENDQVRTGMVMCRGMRAVSAQWAESRRLQPSTIDNKHTCVMTSMLDSGAEGLGSNRSHDAVG